MIEKGDLVRYKNWHGGHIGRVWRVRIDFDGGLHILVRWYTRGDDKIYEEQAEDLEVINENR